MCISVYSIYSIWFKLIFCKFYIIKLIANTFQTYLILHYKIRNMNSKIIEYIWYNQLQNFIQFYKILRRTSNLIFYLLNFLLECFKLL